MTTRAGTRELAQPFVGDAQWIPVGGHGSSGVWRCGDVFVKQHAGPRKWSQEVRAYREVVAPLQGDGWALPTLLAEDAESCSLVLSAVRGAGVDEGAPWAHREAGRFTAALGALEVESTDPMPLATALVRRMERVLKTLDLPARLEARCREVVCPERLDGVERRWCHRDFTPQNWLAVASGLGVVDFEHTRPDHPLADAVKLWVGAWRRHPGLRESWEEGRGQVLSASEYQQLEALGWVHALGTIAWGVRHGDAATTREGWHSAEALFMEGADR